MTSTSRIIRDQQWWQDTYTGSAISLIAEGILEPWHLLPQSGRHKGRTLFMPDGQPAPAGVSVSKVRTPGSMRVHKLPGGLVQVEITVPEEEQQRRKANAEAVITHSDHRTLYRGTREQLKRAGIPEHWLEGLPRPGKTRGSRQFRNAADGHEVQVSVGTSLEFSVDVKHDAAGTAGLQAVHPRAGLRLVWAARA